MCVDGIIHMCVYIDVVCAHIVSFTNTVYIYVCVSIFSTKKTLVMNLKKKSVCASFIPIQSLFRMSKSMYFNHLFLTLPPFKKGGGCGNSEENAS